MGRLKSTASVLVPGQPPFSYMSAVIISAMPNRALYFLCPTASIILSKNCSPTSTTCPLTSTVSLTSTSQSRARP